MVAPPFDAGAVNERAAWPLPATALVMVGAPGGVIGLIEPDTSAKLVGELGAATSDWPIELIPSVGSAAYEIGLVKAPRSVTVPLGKNTKLSGMM